MRRHRVSESSIVILALFLSSLAHAASEPEYIHVGDVDWRSVLKAPPEEATEPQQRDIATMLDWQQKRTHYDVARCNKAAKGDAFYVGRSLGAWFNKESFPQTAALLKQAGDDASRIKDQAKEHFHRRRPYDADPHVHPCIPKENSFTYPSGHAVRGIVWSTILAELFPEHRKALLIAGEQYGNDRFIAGVHYPADVKAGQELGAAIAKRLLGNPQFQKDLERAEQECHAPAGH